MDANSLRRPKSAPAKSFKTTINASRFVTRMTSGRKSSAEERENLTLAETMNKFHTTERMEQRLKERRRTEADINVIEKPTELLASEMASKKMTYGEMENVVARVCRPTASYSARISSNRRINARDIYVPPAPVHVQYFSLHGNRFNGNRSINTRDLKSLIDRLSSYNPTRKPPESRRPEVLDVRQQLGPLASYRWKGLRNC